MVIDLCRLAPVALALNLGCVLPAAHAEAGRDEACTFGAFVEEHDPAGLNVRSAPDPKAAVIGKLPPIWISKQDNLQERVEVEVFEARNGWFRIRRAEDFTRLSGRPSRPTFDGEGWVSGTRLSVKTQALRGRASPSSTSASVFKSADGDPLDSDALMEASRPIDCKGDWVQLEFNERRLPKDVHSTLQIAPQARKGAPPGRFRVWVNQICGIQETTCDGRGLEESTR
ncbi:SH3 domain-containing protein [Roseateles sp. So40a]|uniref:SH3 domain-containing protein n=1 Tax=Roseateles sp. So40a TaxID=3400226 RepID=UPI003A8B166E